MGNLLSGQLSIDLLVYFNFNSIPLLAIAQLGKFQTDLWEMALKNYSKRLSMTLPTNSACLIRRTNMELPAVILFIVFR